MKNFVKAAEKLAFEEYNKTQQPIKHNIYLATSTGIRIANELKADEQIVEAGTYLMDCMLGQAISEGRIQDHVQMSLDRTNALLESFDLDEKTKENIRHCVSEHHGVKKFHSLESEICCNADCYRFISIEGFSASLRYLREMPWGDLIKLLDAKVEEKWNALSLDISKEELTPQYKIIRSYLDYLL